MKKIIALGVIIFILAVSLTGCDESNLYNNALGNTNSPSSGSHVASAVLEFSSLENFLSAHKAVNAGENIDNLVASWRGRTSTATLDATVEVMGFALMERLYQPINIPETYRLFRIMVYNGGVRLWYLPEEYFARGDTTQIWMDSNRDFIFFFSHGTQPTTNNESQQNNPLLITPSNLSWATDTTAFLLNIPKAILTDDVDVVVLEKFTELEIVYLIYTNYNLSENSDDSADNAIELVYVGVDYVCQNRKLAEAYFLVFQYLFEADPALNHEIKYIALDLSEIKFQAQDVLIRLVEDFCAEFGFTLLLNDFEGLREKGYITFDPLPPRFQDGIIISFQDITLTDDTLVTKAEKWRSGRGAIGSTFTVEKTDGTWELLPLESMWAS